MTKYIDYTTAQIFAKDQAIWIKRPEDRVPLCTGFPEGTDDFLIAAFVQNLNRAYQAGYEACFGQIQEPYTKQQFHEEMEVLDKPTTVFDESAKAFAEGLDPHWYGGIPEAVSVDPDDAPELTDAFFKSADLYDGDILIRKGIK